MSEPVDPSGVDDLPTTASRQGESKLAGGPVGMPERTASNDADLASTTQPPSTSDDDARISKWGQQVAAAEITWAKLNRGELVRTEGRIQKLADLVQERYAVSREEAERGVMRFFDKLASTS